MKTHRHRLMHTKEVNIRETFSIVLIFLEEIV